MAEPTIRIVAIDDDTTNLALVAAVLGGYHVTTYSHPREALDALRDGDAPDLIVCDITMPGLDGFGLLEAMRTIPKLRSVPFVYLSALSAREIVRRGMNLGADDYLTKPFTPAELREAVRTRLERTGVLRHDAASELRITSLGGLGLVVGERRLHWEAKKAAELLLLLLDGRGRVDFAHARRELWSGNSADNHLHVLVSRLRKTLQELATVAVADEALTLHFDGRLRWDAAEFTAAAEAALQAEEPAPLENAIRLYAGPFLPGFDSPWAERKRGDLEDLYLELLEAAVTRAPSATAEARARARLERFMDLDVLELEA